jgi:hypothetical protein
MVAVCRSERTRFKLLGGFMLLSGVRRFVAAVFKPVVL